MSNFEGKIMLGDTRVTNDGSIIGAFRHSRLIVRILACVIIVAFGGLVTTPAVAAIRKEIKTHPWQFGHQDPTGELSTALNKLQNELPRIASAPTQPAAGVVRKAIGTTDEVSASKRSRLHKYLDKLNRIDRKIDLQFAATRKRLEHQHLPPVILKRERDAERQFHERAAAFSQPLKAAYQAKNVAGFQKQLKLAMHQLGKHTIKQPREKFDPHNLPFAVAQNRHIKPRLTSRAYKLNPVSGPNAAVKKLTTSGLNAATSSSTAPANPDDPSYLASTIDVQLTDAIKAKAAALDHDPVKIFNWVHNNIDYIPTYGSIQGSAQTLATKRGNSFDTASLLIALLRASNIPARYVYGTIRVPIGEVENWVGGVTSPNAALNLLGQGGIPVTGLAQGGQIKYAKLEHVWVEAWVNFIPSRALRPGAGNTWVPMDASFKQYSYKQGLDIQSTVPFDSTSFLQKIQNGSTIDTQAGTIQGMDSVGLQNQEFDYFKNVKSYLSNLGKTTKVSDVIGSQEIILDSSSVLSSSLPYHLIAVGKRMAVLPSNLRWKFSYTLQNQYGSDVISYAKPTASIAGQNIDLNFRAATDADAKTILSYIPSNTTNVFDPSTLPEYMPGYLIELSPVLEVDGKAVANATSQMKMGEQLQGEMGYWSPQNGWHYYENNVTAGEYDAIGLDLLNISSAHNAAIQKQMNTASEILNGNISNSTNPYDLTGSFLQAGIAGYFGLNDSMDEVAQRAAGVVSYRLPSFGTFHTQAKTLYSYGIPTKVGFPGVTMDVGYNHYLGVSTNNSHENVVRFFERTGPRESMLEGIVPEELFSATDNSATGISAMKALEIAIKNGQKIYAVTAGNYSAVTPSLNLDANVLSDIRNAVAAGKEVIVPQSGIQSSGWSGAGYVILDPATGSGAYKISGGANGGGYVFPPSDPVSDVSTIISWLGYGQQGASFLAKAKVKSFSDYKTALEDAGHVLVAASAFTALVYVTGQTGNLWEGTAAGIIDLIISTLLADVFSSLAVGLLTGLLGGLLAPILIEVIAAVLVAYLLTELENFLFKELFGVSLLDRLKRINYV